MKCPKCSADLKHIVFDAQMINVDRCTNKECKGVWMDKGELAQFTSVDDDVPDMVGSMQDLKETKYSCPKCVTAKLFQMPYAPYKDTQFAAKNFLVDYCKGCCGIWLDSTELHSAEEVVKTLRINKRKMMSLKAKN